MTIQFQRRRVSFCFSPNNKIENVRFCPLPGILREENLQMRDVLNLRGAHYFQFWSEIIRLCFDKSILPAAEKAD